MASIDKIEVNSTSYDVEDARVGALSSLATDDKTSIVNAVNEVQSEIVPLDISYVASSTSLVINTQ